MAKDFARRFYNSPAWKNAREAYSKSRGHLCEVCLAKGIFKPCEIVHHTIELTPENIDDPTVTLNWDNLQCVCRECHAEIHDLGQYYGRKKRKNRYEIDDFGRIFIAEAPPG